MKAIAHSGQVPVPIFAPLPFDKKKMTIKKYPLRHCEQIKNFFMAPLLILVCCKKSRSWSRVHHWQLDS
jgi:hypothetical protein